MKLQKPYGLATSFSKTVPPLRKYFEEIYANPRYSDSRRFQWDIWNVEGQYRHLRTSAEQFFPKQLYQTLCYDLVRFGQSQFGCHTISKPWLSLYLDGNEQKLHSDSPHGPWAYVLSLSPNPLKFQGGSTLILKPQITDYWNHYHRNKGLEQKDLFYSIKPKFNQLLFFDPRYPHGVDRVSQAMDPREGRLVIHGWFVQPEPYVKGGLERLSRLKLSKITNQNILLLTRALTTSSEQIPQKGTLNINLRVTAKGNVSSAKITTNTLWPNTKAARVILNAAKTSLWPKCAAPSQIVLPLFFD